MSRGFFIGIVGDEAMEEELKKEAEEFKDICRVSLVESYEGLVHKVLAVFSWFREATPVNILMKVDDDVLFDPDRLQLILQLGNQTKQTGASDTLKGKDVGRCAERYETTSDWQVCCFAGGFSWQCLPKFCHWLLLHIG